MKRQNKCEVCRQRKIKCDEERPLCGPCAEGGRPCTYKVKRESDSGLRLARTRHAPKGSGTFQRFATYAYGEVLSQKRSYVGFERSDDHGLHAGRHASPAFPNVKDLDTWVLHGIEEQSMSLSCSMVQRQLINICIDVFVPRPRGYCPRLRSELDVDPGWHWESNAFAAAFDDPLLTNVVLGFSISLLPMGRTEQGTYMRRILYHRAYQSLQVRLSNPEARLSDTVLATIKYLGMYEGETCVESCTTHFKGAMTLTQARGTMNWETRAGANLCLHTQLCRVIVFWYNGTRLPQPSVPGDPPGELVPDATLINILCRIPDVVGQVTDQCDGVDSGTAMTNPDWPSLVQDLEDLEADIVSWKDANQEPQSYWIEPSHFSQDQETNGSPSHMVKQICFKDIRIARQCLLLWTAELSIQSAKLRVARAMRSPTKLSAREKGLDALHRIFQTFEYFWHPDMGLSGPKSLEVYPAFCVAQSFVSRERLRREAQWLLNFSVFWVGPCLTWTDDFLVLANSA